MRGPLIFSSFRTCLESPGAEPVPSDLRESLYNEDDGVVAREILAKDSGSASTLDPRSRLEHSPVRRVGKVVEVGEVDPPARGDLELTGAGATCYVTVP